MQRENNIKEIHNNTLTFFPPLFAKGRGKKRKEKEEEERTREEKVGKGM